MVISSKMKGRSLRRSRNLHYRQTISKYFNVIKQKTDMCSDVLFDLIFNPNSCWIVAPILLIVEVFINILIIEKAKCEYILILPEKTIYVSGMIPSVIRVLFQYIFFYYINLCASKYM